MTKEDLKVLLRNPDQTEQAVDELKSIIEEYPYFHTGHLLYLKGLRKTDEKKMALQLKKTALCVRDRDVLYHYINQTSQQINSRQSVPVQPEEEKQTIPKFVTGFADTSEEVDDVTPVEIRDVYSEKELVDDLIKVTLRKSDRAEATPSQGITVTTDCAETTPSQSITVKEKENISPSDENKTWSPSELIDFFLKSNHKIVPNDNQYEVDLSESLHEDQDGTETLADIYATQGHKNKAIEIYQQLILKYPEKHIYFAAQINRLKD